MKTGFYPKLALEGIRKNKRMFLPYIFTCTGMVMMYYIIQFLRYSPTLANMTGGALSAEIVGLGSWVIAVFACLFLFYTNAFLLRRRKKEFGLYHILGMGKGNIARILLWESVFIALFALVVGLGCGIALSKLAELGLVRVIHLTGDYHFSVSLSAMAMTCLVFGVIFVLLFFNALRQVQFASAISLLRSEAAGEKPPKGNWILGLAGLVILGAAYYIAVTIADPLVALFAFFIAVIMVVVATYLLMISGSVLLCRVLQKRKGYYYKANHFVSVSSMAYRMKRNGAGLASICILATMVLVMISSTASLYFGGENAVLTRYPREMDLQFILSGPEALRDENIDQLYTDIGADLAAAGVTAQNAYHYRSASVAGLIVDDTVSIDASDSTPLDIASGSTLLCQFYFVPLRDYNQMMGTQETLAPGEVLLFASRTTYEPDTITFIEGQSFRIKKHLDTFVGSGTQSMMVAPSIIVVVPDLSQGIQGLDTLTYNTGNALLSYQWLYNFDTGLSEEDQLTLYAQMNQIYHGSYLSTTYGVWSCHWESRAANRDDFYALSGGLFYLGILLSIVFLFAAVLIIYYKQISEGYEDQGRFAIMQKVGMTKAEIRRSINSQLLTVFFLPLGLAVLHLAFAFPMIQKLLLLFQLDNALLFAGATVVSVMVFALFYTLVYRITSNGYYNIVSQARQE